MKPFALYLFAGLVAAPLCGWAAPDPDEIESLKRELRELRQKTETLEKRLLEIEASPPRSVPDAVSAPPGTDVTGSAVEATAPGSEAGEAPAAAKQWSPTDPITLVRAGNAYMNIGFDAMVNFGWSSAAEPSDYLELGDHDPSQRGFSMRNAEIVLEGAVDPYFTAMANFNFKLDNDNETSIEAEEVYAKTTALPASLQLRAGQYFANFGRQNPQHPHSWAFVDQPLVLNRTLGPEGLRNLGAELAWLAPTPFFTELTLSVMNGNSSQAFLFRNAGEPDGAGVERFRGRETTGANLRGPGDLLFVPRIASSFDLTDEQTLLAGLSGAFGPNRTGAGTDTQIYGADVYWKWKPVNSSKGFPFVAFQTEGIVSRFEAGGDPAVPLPIEVLYDYGFYSQVLWGFREHWVAGLRGDWVDGTNGADDPNDVYRNERWRISPNLTWYPTEFSKIRLQYNYDRGELFGDDHSVWLQFEFQLGAHSPHKF